MRREGGNSGLLWVDAKPQQTNFNQLLNLVRTHHTRPCTGPNDWIKLNAGQAVPMRVAYTPDMMARLANAVK